MIRFPNPGSDIPTFIHIFQTLYTYLSGQKAFTLDDMSQKLTEMNLAASSGYVGAQALLLSTRKDRSRDPLYNQSKMYAELYRSLGWMSSSEEKALIFSFTLLGEHMAGAKIDPKSIFEESVLGINYPNQIIDNKNQDASRTFAAILRSAYELGGYICRDEIIVGAMNVNDTDNAAFELMVTNLKAMRGDFRKLQKAMIQLSERTKIQINTLQNYTRFPLSVLTYCGWFEKVRIDNLYPNSRNMVTLKMTPYGKKKAVWLKQILDIRVETYEKLDEIFKPAIIRLGFYSMLQRSNFDTTPISDSIVKDENLVNKCNDGNEIIFSPYQTIKTSTVNSALGIENTGFYSDVVESSRVVAEAPADYEVKSTKRGTVRLLHQTFPLSPATEVASEIANKIKRLIYNRKSENEVVEAFFTEYRRATQTVFYSLIADLFCILGFNCSASRAGINYERWDAIAIDDMYSIPIEIKSPTEEEFISIKAVRQALENKIILLSRKSYKTDRSTVSLVIGYNMPNDRAEVARLIKDIKLAFNINVGVIDFKSLLIMSIKKIHGTASVLTQEIREMEGLINVQYS
jgi:hypothetical protein